MLVSNVDMVYDEETEDLKLNDYGELEYYSEQDTPPNAVIRRLGTPSAGYARMVRVGSTAEVYNLSYASALPTLLSSPGVITTDVQNAVELASSQDGRVTPVDFAINEQNGAVHSFTLSYLTPDDNVQSITASV